MLNVYHEYLQIPSLKNIQDKGGKHIQGVSPSHAVLITNCFNIFGVRTNSSWSVNSQCEHAQLVFYLIVLFIHTVLVSLSTVSNEVKRFQVIEKLINDQKLLSFKTNMQFDMYSCLYCILLDLSFEQTLCTLKVNWYGCPHVMYSCMCICIHSVLIICTHTLLSVHAYIYIAVSMLTQ